MTFAERLALYRRKARWSQAELAAQIGVAQNTISKWEQAKSSPSVPEMHALCRTFGVSADYLCGLHDHPNALIPGHWLVDLDAFEHPERATPEDEVFVPIPARACLVDPRRFLEMRDDLTRRLEDNKRKKHRRGK